MKSFFSLIKRTLLLCCLAAVVFVPSVSLGYWGGHRDLLELLRAPEPEECALCGHGERHHAPCVLDLSTGQIGELQVYEPHRIRSGEISPGRQDDGVVVMRYQMGLTFLRFPDENAAGVTLPLGASMDPGHFCRPCRLRLEEAAPQSYVLLDLYDLENIRLYPILADKEYEIRGYTAHIQRGPQHHALTVHLTGHYFE